MNRIYSIADQSVACLNQIDFSHPMFESCNTNSMTRIAERIRTNILPISLPEGDGMDLRYARENETPEQLLARCLNNTWRVVGHEYQLEKLNYNISPDPSENGRGLAFGEWTWQLNRHEEWLPVALHYHRTGDHQAIEALVSWIRTWVETCPAPTQECNTELSSWRTIEIGIRLGGVWPAIFQITKNSKTLDDELFLAWLNSVAEQCDFVWRHRTKRNWLMMEMNGLLTAALMFPFFKKAPEWRKNAHAVYLEEIDNQFLPDGMQIELSASYHGVSLKQYLRAYRLLKGAGEDIPPKFISGMRKMLAPWRAMVRPNGHVFGFQDDGGVDYPSWLRQLPKEIQTPEDAFFSRGGPAPSHLNDLLPYAGQGVLRSGWTMKDTAVAIDVGPFGAAHQHEDKLSIQVWSHGKDLLGEAGIVNYADSPQRRYSLGTLAHSTALVDGLGQNSRRVYRGDSQDRLNACHDVDCDLEVSSPWIKGTYEHGYGKEGKVAVRHERTVILNSEKLITVTDHFFATDAKRHVVEILFHLLKHDYIVQDAEARSIGESPNIAIAARSTGGVPLTISGVRGGTEPDLRGWAAMDRADYKGSNDLVPRPCITVTARMERSLEVVTELRILD